MEDKKGWDSFKETIDSIREDLANSTRTFYIWTPQKDITAYELAECLEYVKKTLYSMPNVSEESKRHFTKFIYDPKDHKK